MNDRRRAGVDDGHRKHADDRSGSDRVGAGANELMHRTIVCVLMVLIMRMQMVVLQHFVRVEVAMPFAKKQDDASDHRGCRDDIEWAEDRPKNNKCENGAHKRRR